MCDRRRRRAAPRGRAGFTLIELLVVVGIIAILVGIVVAVIPKVKAKVYATQTQAQMAAIANACQQYFNDFRAYPGPIANNQLGQYFYTLNGATNPPAPANVTSLGVTTTAGTTTYTASGFSGVTAKFTNGGSASQNQMITGSENLVLGIAGGLELDTQNQNPDGTYPIAFNINAIFPDGTSPGAKGPVVLNAAAPKRFPPYIQIRPGDLTTPNSNMGTSVPLCRFQDEATRGADDTGIPEFLDKYGNPMPIIYLRANVGATGIVTLGGVDPQNTSATHAYQYDLAGALGYTGSSINLNPGVPNKNYHGLRGIMPTAAADAITHSVMADYNNTSAPGANALAYLKDYNAPQTKPDGTYYMNGTGQARQKDAFILISAGPDRIYGTADDLVYPGGTVEP